MGSSKEEFKLWKEAHPEDGCREDCKVLFQFENIYYCIKHMDKMESLDGCLCHTYQPDKVKVVTEKTKEMIAIDRYTEEDLKRNTERKKEWKEKEAKFKEHCNDCSDFKIVMEHFYRTFDIKGGSMFGKQMFHSYFQHCPCCGSEFE